MTADSPVSSDARISPPVVPTRSARTSRVATARWGFETAPLADLRGGFAEVFRAADKKRGGQLVAVKVLHDVAAMNLRRSAASDANCGS
jgi:hypothetical protein